MKNVRFVDLHQGLCTHTPQKGLFLCAHTVSGSRVFLASKMGCWKDRMFEYIIYNKEGWIYHIELTFGVRKGDAKEKMWVVSAYFWEKVCGFRKIKVFLQLLYQRKQ